MTCFQQGLNKIYRNNVTLPDYDQAIFQDPALAIAYNARARMYGVLKNHDQALLGFNKAIELEPENAKWHNNYGYTNLQLGNMEQALAGYNKALELNPALTTALFNRAYFYEDIGQQYELAKLDYITLLESTPESSRALSDYAWFLATVKDPKFKDPEKALPLSLKAVTQSKRNNVAYLDTLGAVYAALGQFDKAVETQMELIGILEGKGNLKRAEDYKKVLTDYEQGKVHY